jgi:hypothetical protein
MKVRSWEFLAKELDVHSIALSDDESYFVAASSDKVQIFDLFKREVFTTFQVERQGELLPVIISPNSKYVAVNLNSWTLGIYGVEKGEHLRNIQDPRRGI